jgi:D-alanyl-D-alanine carboxypeptidase (penicillin-binding protein 5/6)
VTQSASRSGATCARAWAAVAAAAALMVVPPPTRAAAPPPPPAAVQAPAAIVVEPSTGDVVFRRNADERRAIASATKLMTALVAIQRLSLDDVLTAAPYRAAAAESVIGLRSGERMTAADLLRGVLLASGNDAAETLAVAVAGTPQAFVRLMNERARELHLTNTHFTNPIGLDEAGNYSSAADLAKLTLVVRRSRFFRTTTDLPRVTVGRGARRRTIVNRNLLIAQVPFVNGVKTGHTLQAGHVLVGSATRAGVTMVSVVLGDPSEGARDADTLALLRYGLVQYQVVRPVVSGREVATVKLRYRDERAPLLAGATVARTVRRGERLQVRLTGVPSELDGPLPEGARVGTIEVHRRGRVVARAPIVTASDLHAASFAARLRSYVARPVTLVAVALLAICSLQLVVLRRRAERRRRRRRQAELA